jgi:uncharacterized membrane protein YdjX (TVP38/TMEM64 family)
MTIAKNQRQAESLLRPLMILLVTVLLLLMLYYLAVWAGWIEMIMNPAQLLAILQSHNQAWTGIVIIVGLMAMAIVFNPIPSAPVALVAGAIYGHTWGTVYIVTGALIGAIIAFFISRLAGRAVICRLLGEYSMPSWIGSQNSMMITVLISRLVPFISFDLVSYAAGLTSLRLWRFFIATLIGLLPASFLLAHFGSKMTADNLNESMAYVFIIGILILLPIVWGLIKHRKKPGQ